MVQRIATFVFGSYDGPLHGLPILCAPLQPEESLIMCGREDQVCQSTTEESKRRITEMVQWLDDLLADRVWHQMEDWLRAHCPAHLAGKASPSDIIQSAFRMAHLKKEQCEGENEEVRAAWFRAIVRNKLKETIKRYTSDKRDVRREEHGGNRETGEPATLFENCTSADGAPDLQVIDEEIRSVVRSVVHSLPEPQTEVIYLRFYENLSRTEIAERLGISNGTVANRMRQAMANLRSSLNDEVTLCE